MNRCRLQPASVVLARKKSQHALINSLPPGTEDYHDRAPSNVDCSSSFSATPQSTARLDDAGLRNMNLNVGRQIEPYEATICIHLIQQIVSSSRLAGTHIDQPAPSTTPLSDALSAAAVTIQYHARWFAPGPLSTLLQTALELAGRSTHTIDIYRALELIDTITTYSHLPVVLPAARFIALAYYQGSRSNRHRRLSQSAWAVAQHILESHLGGQFIGCLLDVISDPEHTRSRAKFCASIGALMITAQKLPSTNGQHLPSMQPTQILLNLDHNGVLDPVLREQIITTLSTMLLDDSAFEKMEQDGSLEICLRLAERCVDMTIDQFAADQLFRALELKAKRFEPRLQSTIAKLYIHTRRPLPSDLSEQLLLPWRTSLLMDEQTLWENEYRNLLSKLCDCSFYLKELDSFVDTAVSAFFRLQNPVFRRDFVNTLETLMLDPITEESVRDVLSLGMVKIFTHNMQKSKWEGERNWLFPLMCRLARDCPNVTEVLLRIRADAAGDGYLEVSRKENRRHGEVNRGFPSIHGLSTLALETWVTSLRAMIVHNSTKWEVYDMMLTGLAAQLRNHTLWRTHPQHVNALREALCSRLSSDSFLEPPASTGLSKSYVISQLLQILTAIITYHNHLPRNDIKVAIATFINVAGSRDHTVSIHCINALTICCYELPELMAGYMDVIISKMSKMVTQRHVAMYVLEFLAGLSRLPALQDKLDIQDVKRIFGVCHSYLQTIRGTTMLERKRTPTSERSAATSSTSNDDMAQYVYALAHHVITFWYVALKKSHRKVLKDYITNCLKYTDGDGREHIEDQGLVTIDLMDRVDAEEGITAPSEDAFDALDGRVIKRHRLSGLLLITTETALRTSKTIITIRRPSGTAQRILNSHRRSLDTLSEQLDASITVENDDHDYITVFPDDIQGRTYGKVSVPGPASALGSVDTITLSDDDSSVRRALVAFDRTSALDSHKAGVIYIGEGQHNEEDILLNESGSPDYREFVHDLGTLKRLKGATFNAQGLDRAENADGEHTIVWNNDVTELVYHITTFMPQDPFEARTTVINKKRHIGNDFVNIIFNNSGDAFAFDTFPSAFNYVYIVISPSERTSFLQARTITNRKDKRERFYNVQVLARPGYPNLSSASDEKVISGASLGSYVRNLALNACVFCAMWNADDVGEYPSSWRRRLQMLRKLGEQHRPRSMASHSSLSGVRSQFSGNRSQH